MDKKYLIVAVVAVAVIAGCVVWFGFYDNSAKSLSQDVAGFSRGCPVEIVAGNVIESMTYDEDANNVTADISASSHKFVSSDSADHASKVILLFQDAENRRLLKDMVKAGASLTLRYDTSRSLDAGSEHGDSDVADIVISPADLAAIESQPLLTGKERAILGLQSRAITLGQLCPLNWNDDAQLINVAVDPAEKMFYLYIKAGKVEPSDNQIKVFKRELKAQRHDDSQMMNMVSELAAAGYGIRVCYLEDDGLTIGPTMDIPAQDIYNISQLH